MLNTLSVYLVFFFFNDPATTEIYTLSLHDALPIWSRCMARTACGVFWLSGCSPTASTATASDRKSTRLNSSHSQISYAVFCLKKKKRTNDGRRVLGEDNGLAVDRSASLAR